jgi:endonuclease YncB( thermonuclease family)
LSALKRIALALAGLALVAALWIGGQATISRLDGSTEAARRAEPRPTDGQAAQPLRKEAGKDAREERPWIRRIAPGSIAEPEVAGPLQRVAPREPLTAATKALKREPFGPPVPQGTLLYQPVAIAAGAIEADGYAIRFAGVKVTPADRICTDEAGSKWPCGAMARTALRAWMRGRAVACAVPSHAGKITTHCTLDGQDMALWLVRNGWAESAGAQYGDAEAEARRGEKGMFGPSPLETPPE